MTTRAAALLAMCIMALLVAGCQPHQAAYPPPSFEPPTVRLPGPVPLPSGDGNATPTGATIQRQQASISEVSADRLINAAALKPKAEPRPWKYIIIHHSDTPYGSALRFHKAHLARGWDMLGYDFVIGNGTETKDGLIEVGPRWTQQLPGAHTGTPDHIYNDYGIGICLVGNFDETRPTPAELDSLARLCAYLMKTYSIPATQILGHRDCKPTNCPGRYMDISQVRQLAEKYLAQMK